MARLSAMGGLVDSHCAHHPPSTPGTEEGAVGKEISANAGAKKRNSAADDAHDKGTADMNAERQTDLSGREGPAQTLDTEQALNPEVDGDLGVSRNISDRQPNADNLPATIDAGNAKLPG